METIISTSPAISHGRVDRMLLACGVTSSLLYILMNIFIPMGFDGYSYLSQTVSELSAINAPTRTIWVFFGSIWVTLVAVFGIGVLRSARINRRLRILGWIIVAYAIVNVYWPPMHLRGEERSLTDTLHIVWTMMTVPLMILMMGIGATAFGRSFRLYSIFTLATLLGFGYLTGMDAPNLNKNLPTPWLGVWERIMIAAFMLWFLTLALRIMRQNNTFENRQFGSGTVSR
jgi:hypothetical protein